MEELRSQNVPSCLEGGHRHLVLTIPGVGPILATAIIGHIGDIRRFSSARRLVAYAGIRAFTRQFGEFSGTRTQISKRGSPELRRAVWLAAVCTQRFNPKLRAYCEAKKQERKHPRVATGAVARRLLHLIHLAWTHNQPYDPDYKWRPSGSVE